MRCRIMEPNLQQLEQQLEEDLIMTAKSFQKYKEAIIGLDEDKRIKTFNNEDKPMVQDELFQVVNA